MFTALAFIIAYWHLILVGGGVTVGLGVVGYVTRNWKAVVAAVAVVGLCIGAATLELRGYKRHAAQVLAEQTLILRERVVTLEEMAAEDGKRAAADAAKIAELERQALETPPNTAPSLPRASGARINKVK